MKIGILEGDDIGHEVVPETVKVMRAAAEISGLKIDWHPMPIGKRAYDTLGSTLPSGTLEKLEQLDGWVLGPIGHMAYPKVPEAVNPHPILRKHFDLFANIRPALSYPGIPSLHQNVDLVIVVSAPETIQRTRVLARAGMTEPKLDAILSRQMSDAEKRRRAHFIIDTRGAHESTRAVVAQFMRSTAALAGGRTRHA